MQKIVAANKKHKIHIQFVYTIDRTHHDPYSGQCAHVWIFSNPFM